jgi:hypothetical protein
MRAMLSSFALQKVKNGKKKIRFNFVFDVHFTQIHNLIIKNKNKNCSIAMYEVLKTPWLYSNPVHLFLRPMRWPSRYIVGKKCFFLNAFISLFQQTNNAFYVNFIQQHCYAVPKTLYPGGIRTVPEADAMTISLHCLGRSQSYDFWMNI